MDRTNEPKDYKTMAVSIAIYVVALIAPVVLFATTLLHEKYPVLPFIVCIPLMAGAGYLTSRTEGDAVNWKWVAWSALFGLIVALLFVLT